MQVLRQPIVVHSLRLNTPLLITLNIRSLKMLGPGSIAIKTWHQSAQIKVGFAFTANDQVLASILQKANTTWYRCITQLRRTQSGQSAKLAQDPEDMYAARTDYLQ